MASKIKYYDLSIMGKTGDYKYCFTQPDSNDIAVMAGVIIPFDTNLVSDRPNVNINMYYDEGGGQQMRSYTAQQLRTSTSHTVLSTGASVDSTVYYFDNALTEVQSNIPVTKIDYFWTPQITVMGTHISNEPAVVVCNKYVTRLEFEWDDTVVLTDPTFQSNLEASIGYVQIVDNQSNWTHQTYEVEITVI